MYALSKNPKQLHQMDIQPGNLNAEYRERSQTVFGAISVACPPLFLEKILSTMNRNLEARNNERIEKETMVQKVVQKLSIVAKCFRGRQVIKPRNGAPNGCGGSPTRRLVLIRNRVRKRFMTRNHHLVRRSRRMVYRKPFSLQELKNILGLLIFTKQHPAPSLKHYWRHNGDVDHKPPRQVMPRDRFLECLSCFKFTEDYVTGVEKDFRAHMAHIWKSANMGVVDESINPFRGRKNPHHVFIPRKPHPHDLKNWVTVDYSGFCLDCSLFRRVEPPVKTHNTLLQMSEQLSEDSLVVADSYFGSMKSLEGLVERNQHALLACRANRPSGIFKNRLCKNMSEGEVRSEYGTVGVNPFMSTCSRNNGKNTCLVSTVFDGSTISTKTNTLVPGDTEEQQSTLVTTKINRSKSHQQYSDLMGFVDDCDREILYALPQLKKYHWTTAHMM